MRHRVLRVFGAAVALAITASACSDEPPLFPGGDPGVMADIRLATNGAVLRVDDTLTVAAQAVDSAGNPVADAVSFTPCDGRVSVTAGEATDLWDNVAIITALGLGKTCVVAAGGQFADTIRLSFGPGSIVITGPDTVLSGTMVNYGVEFYSVNGNLLTVEADFEVPRVRSLNTLRLPVTRTDVVAYDAAGQQPGLVELQVATGPDGANITAHKFVTIVPGVFGGTMSTNTAAQGASVTVTGNIAWDGDEHVTIGGIVGSNWTGRQADPVMIDAAARTLTFFVPWNLAPGDYEVIVLDQGSGEIAGRVTTPLTVIAGVPVHNQNGFPGVNTRGAELTGRVSLDRPLAFPVVFNTGVTGSTTSYYTFDNRPASGQGESGEKVVRITLDWVDACGAVCTAGTVDEDVDVQIIDGAFTVFLDLDGATATRKPESTHFNFNDGAFYFVRYQTFSGSAATHTVIRWLGDGNLCADQGGCTIDGQP